MDDLEDVIVLPSFKFPQHWQINEWLNGTDYHKEFDLALVEVPQLDRNGNPSRTSFTTPALVPKSKKTLFYWKLKGDAGIRELEQKVLDFKHERVL